MNVYVYEMPVCSSGTTNVFLVFCHVLLFILFFFFSCDGELFDLSMLIWSFELSCKFTTLFFIRMHTIFIVLEFIFLMQLYTSVLSFINMLDEKQQVIVLWADQQFFGLRISKCNLNFAHFEVLIDSHYSATFFP